MRNPPSSSQLFSHTSLQPLSGSRETMSSWKSFDLYYYSINTQEMSLLLLQPRGKSDEPHPTIKEQTAVTDGCCINMHSLKGTQTYSHYMHQRQIKLHCHQFLLMVACIIRSSHVNNMGLFENAVRSFFRDNYEMVLEDCVRFVVETMWSLLV